MLLVVPSLTALTELDFLPDVVNDLDFDASENPAVAAAYKNDQRNIRKVKEATKKLQVKTGYKPGRQHSSYSQ